MDNILDRFLGEKYVKWILVLPALIFLVAMTIFPTFFAYYLSVNRITIETFRKPIFVGAENYVNIVGSREMWYSLGFTIIYTLATVSLELILGVALALLFYSRIHFKSFLVSLLVVPLGVAPALYGLMFRLMLDPITGVVPALFRLLGIKFSPFASYWTTLISLVLIDVLQWTPFVFIIIYAALHALPIEPFEAALIDGASSAQIVRYITLPLIKPALVVAILFRAMDAFKIFDTIYVITGGGPGISTSTVSIYIYRLTFLLGRFGLGAASTIILFYISMFVVTLVFKMVYRGGGG